MIFGISYAVIGWLIAAILLAILEAETQGMVSLWFSIGAVVTFLVALAGASVTAQFIVFVIVSGGMLYFLRPFARNYLKVKTVKTNSDRFVGGKGEVIQEIIYVKGGGQVKIQGQIWSAQSSDGSDIPLGSSVEVEKIAGVKLIVKKVNS
jgi:membrane protein implicated in regulation of membrane protease activity